jgi:hypothetical protein
LFNFGAYVCFFDKELVQQHKLALVKKVTSVGIEVINNCSFSSGLVTHETKALEITIGSHFNKVMFNVISSLKNPIIIGLSWLILHNPQVDWHMRSLHFETPKQEPWIVKPLSQAWLMKHMNMHIMC